MDTERALEAEMSQQKVSHSLNRFRTKMRKLKGDKNGSDPAGNKPSAAVVATTPITGSTSSPTGFLGAPKEKRKAVSVSTPPDMSSSPVHQVGTTCPQGEGATAT